MQEMVVVLMKLLLVGSLRDHWIPLTRMEGMGPCKYLHVVVGTLFVAVVNLEVAWCDQLLQTFPLDGLSVTDQ